MEDIHSLRQTLEACQARFDNKISPAIEAADQAVQEYGFSSYMDLMAEMMRLSKTIVAASKKIKELSTIEDEIEEMDDLLEIYEPIVNEHEINYIKLPPTRSSRLYSHEEGRPAMWPVQAHRM